MVRPTKASFNPILSDLSLDVTLEGIWSELTEDEKVFIMVFPFFDTRAEAARFLEKNPRWYSATLYRRKTTFGRAIKLRFTTTDEAAMSLLKVDLAGKALAQTYMDVRSGGVDSKELRGLLRTLTGKPKPSKEPARKGNLVDMRSMKSWQDDDDDDQEDNG